MSFLVPIVSLCLCLSVSVSVCLCTTTCMSLSVCVDSVSPWWVLMLLIIFVRQCKKLFIDRWQDSLLSRQVCHVLSLTYKRLHRGNITSITTDAKDIIFLLFTFTHTIHSSVFTAFIVYRLSWFVLCSYGAAVRAV